MALNLKTLGTRALTALVFVVVLLGCLLWNYYSFSIFFFVVSLMGLNEFYKLSVNLNSQPYRVTGFICSIVLYASFIDFNYLNDYSNPFPDFRLLLILIPFIIFTVALFSKRDKPIQNSLFTIAGLIYSVVPFALLHGIVISQEGEKVLPYFDPSILFGIILLIWSNDTFAYLGGSLFGKNKMIERISPGKTWEGTLFGFLMTIGSGYIVARFFIHGDTFMWLILGTVVPVMATIGDLVESMIKRQAGIKDTGNLMPGHGGILDRFDSLIFVAPFVYVVVKLLNA
ncbi:hypothetical protein CNR22_22040 [Sphingobacteriaceae bacterium]|nr:hypothetical protein CNR22_22040 [Sphingobacteriaceae bacterium]